MVRVEKSIEIKASPEKVWEMLALDRLPEWDEGYEENLKRVEYTSEVRKPKDKYKVGATANGIPKKKGEEWSFDITESLENKKIAYGAKGGWFKGVIITSILEPIGDGTKFTFVVDAELPWGFLANSSANCYTEKAKERSRGR